jgi:hypothetical protein
VKTASPSTGVRVERSDQPAPVPAAPGGQLAYPFRWLVIAGLLASGASHLPVLREHVIAAPYMGWLFGAFVVLCVSLTVPVCLHDSRAVYVTTVALSVAALLVYAATRLIPFPRLADEVGNWFEPWGMVAVMSEIFTTSTALLALLPPEDTASSD